MKKYILVLVLPLLFVLAACSTKEINTFKEQAENLEPSEINTILQVNEDGLSNVDLKALSQNIETSQTNKNVELNKEVADGIVFMIEEEKLAHDVYTFLYKKWDTQIFNNIANAETTHMNAVKSLADSYGLDSDLYSTEFGVFSNNKLQGLYNDLTAQGSGSLLEALKVGALIEEIDIIDLEEYVSNTNNEDVILVYDNLTKGSRNHLRSFVRNISNQGVDYVPVYMDKDQFAQIIGSDIERGSGRSGGSGRRGR